MISTKEMYRSPNSPPRAPSVDGSPDISGKTGSYVTLEAFCFTPVWSERATVTPTPLAAQALRYTISGKRPVDAQLKLQLSEYAERFAPFACTGRGAIVS